MSERGPPGEDRHGGQCRDGVSSHALDSVALRGTFPLPELSHYWLLSGHFLPWCLVQVSK